MNMFIHECTVCAKEQLIFPSQVAAVAATEQGYELTFACWCGAEQTVVRKDSATAALAAV